MADADSIFRAECNHFVEMHRLAIMKGIFVHCVAVTALLAACSAPPEGTGRGETQPDAYDVLQQIGMLGNYTLQDEDDSTACQTQGCLEMVTTPRLTISQWTDVAAAARWRLAMTSAGDVRQGGRFVLAFVGEQQTRTDQATRAAWTRRAEELSAVG